MDVKERKMQWPKGTLIWEGLPRSGERRQLPIERVVFTVRAVPLLSVSLWWGSHNNLGEILSILLEGRKYSL